MKNLGNLRCVWLCATAALSVNALNSPISNATFSTELHKGTFGSDDLLAEIKLLIDDNVSANALQYDPPLEFLCAQGEPPKKLDPRDFFLNSYGTIRSISLKAPDRNAQERPRVLSALGAQKVAIHVGGGPAGKDPLPRCLLLRILVRMMRYQAEFAQFNNLRCQFLKYHGSEEVIGFYQTVPADQPQDLLIDPSTDPDWIDPDSTSWSNLQGSDAIVNRRRLGSRQIVNRDVPGLTEQGMPILDIRFSERMVLDITAFYYTVAGTTEYLAFDPKEVGVDYLSFIQATIGIGGAITGVKRPARLMTVGEAIETMHSLVRHQLIRVDSQGKQYNGVTGEIFAHGDRTRKIGSLLMFNARGAGDLEGNDVVMLQNAS